jgi:hypothetical protein
MALGATTGWACGQSGGTVGLLNTSWNAVTGAASYEVWANTSATPGGTRIASGLTGTAASIYPSLSTGTVYWYYLRAIDSSGVAGAWSGARGGSAAWDVQAPPTPSISVPATNSPATSRSVTISWSAVSDAYSNPVTYFLTRAGTQIYSGTATSYTDTPASDGSYTYAVYAKDSHANQSGSTSGTCRVTLVTVPATPSVPTATKSSATQITVSWPTVSGATSYYLYRNGAYFTSTSAASYVDAPGDGTWYYAVAAANAAGTSATSGNSPSIVIDTTPPPVPSITSAYQQVSTARTVYVAWSATTGATSYRLERTGGTGGTVTQTVSATNATDTPAADGTYTYRVYAADSAGNWSAASTGVNVTVTLVPIPAAPAAPALVQPYGATRDVQMSWPAAANAASYVVYRGATAGALAQVGTAAGGAGVAGSYTDTPPADGTYFYAVQSGNATGSSNVGAAASTTIDRVRTGMAGL